MSPDRDPALDEDAELMDEVAPVERFLDDEGAPASAPGAPVVPAAEEQEPG